jgi:hypothetical protein
MDDTATTPAALPTTFHMIGDSYVDYTCLLTASSSLPSVGEDAILPFVPDDGPGWRFAHQHGHALDDTPVTTTTTTTTTTTASGG